MVTEVGTEWQGKEGELQRLLAKSAKKDAEIQTLKEREKDLKVRCCSVAFSLRFYPH